MREPRICGLYLRSAQARARSVYLLERLSARQVPGPAGQRSHSRKPARWAPRETHSGRACRICQRGGFAPGPDRRQPRVLRRRSECQRAGVDHRLEPARDQPGRFIGSRKKCQSGRAQQSLADVVIDLFSARGTPPYSATQLARSIQLFGPLVPPIRRPSSPRNSGRKPIPSSTPRWERSSRSAAQSPTPTNKSP